MTDRRAHWDGVCDAHRANEVSWFQFKSELSLKLISRVGASKDWPILDIGGASALVDHLFERGFRDLSVLDCSSCALDRAGARLEDRGADVEWIAGDTTSWTPWRRYRLWHDCAVLLSLVEPADQAAYASTLRMALAPEDWAIIGGFAPSGSMKRNGLDVAEHDAVSLGRLFGEEFELMETHGEMRATPWGADQVFRYHVFRRKPVRRKCE